MQQAYRALSIVAEAQTIRMILSPHPSELMLKELCTACSTLGTRSSYGVKAVVLDFITSPATAETEGGIPSQASIDEVSEAVRAVTQPVLAVLRGTLSAAACAVVHAADLILAAHDAVFTMPNATSGDERFTGAQAVRLGYVTWSVPAQNVGKEMERVLDLLRGKSAVALRHTKASVLLGQAEHPTQLQALKQVNALYLTQVMQTADAQEGLRAFLEKRQPEWKNQ